MADFKEFTMFVFSKQDMEMGLKPDCRKNKATIDLSKINYIREVDKEEWEDLEEVIIHFDNGDSLVVQAEYLKLTEYLKNK